MHGVAASGLRHGSDVTLVMTEKVRRGLLFVSEDGFDGAVEEASEFEGQWEAGVEFAGLDGVDGLAGDLETLGEVGLGPVVFGTEDTESVLHWYLLRMKG